MKAEDQLFSKIIGRLKSTVEDIQNELEYLPFRTPDCKIGDFGCEWAYTTLALMIALDAVEGIGIDTFIVQRPYEWFPSLEAAQNSLDFIKTTTLTIPENSDENGIISDLRNLLKNGRWPTLQQKDVVNGRDFPKNLDLAFCRSLLQNINTGQYGNSPSGKVGLTLAINNIAGCIQRDGLLCIIEQSDTIDFEPYLKDAGLDFLSMQPFTDRKGTHFIACCARKL